MVRSFTKEKYDDKTMLSKTISKAKQTEAGIQNLVKIKQAIRKLNRRGVFRCKTDRIDFFDGCDSALLQKPACRNQILSEGYLSTL